LGSVLLLLVLAASLIAAGAWTWSTRSAWSSTAPTGPRAAGSSAQSAPGGPAQRAQGTQDVQDTARPRVGRWCSLLALSGTAAAVVIVEVALVRQDTALNYAAMTTAPDMPVYFRITALWSALEGSLLLWLLILAAVLVIAVRSLEDVLEPRAHALVGAILSAFTAAFAGVVLLASPFTVTDEAVAARPSPLLQDHVAMGIHPPLLYGGFLTLAVPYAMAVSGLAAMRMDARWAAHLRRWSLVSWILLTAGIVLGGWWSYAVLGWGGYWAWDPV